MLKKEDYLEIKQVIHNYLLSSSYIKRMTCVNFWNYYGIINIPNMDNKHVYYEYRISIKQNFVEYAIEYVQLGSLPVESFVYSDKNKNAPIKQIISEFIKYCKIQHKKKIRKKFFKN